MTATPADENDSSSQAIAALIGSLSDTSASAERRRRLRDALTPTLPPGVDGAAIVTQTFTAAYAHFSRGGAGDDLDAWLHGYARGLVLDEVKRRRVKPAP